MDKLRERISYKIDINPQPTDTSCGPTCLHGIYDYLGHQKDHHELIKKVPVTIGGGTLGVNLGINALKNGLDVDIYSHNLKIFDPTWFMLSNDEIAQKLEKQAKFRTDPKVIESSLQYAEFIHAGGGIIFKKLTPKFLYEILEQYGPVICGLSATYLYMCKREMDDCSAYNDIEGNPQGHFVILSGISEDLTEVEVTDPLKDNPFAKGQSYTVDVHHFINAILIGVITYDANLIVIYTKEDANE